MERIELFKMIKRRACSIIRANSTLSASEYRELSLMSDKKAIQVGTINVMVRIIKDLQQDLMLLE